MELTSPEAGVLEKLQPSHQPAGLERSLPVITDCDFLLSACCLLIRNKVTEREYLETVTVPSLT